MINSLKKVWNGKTLTESDYDNINTMLEMAIAWMLIWVII